MEESRTLSTETDASDEVLGRPPPTLATNRFAILSSSTVRKGNLLKSPVARDLCKLTERMVVSIEGGNSQVSQTYDKDGDAKEETKPLKNNKNKKSKKNELESCEPTKEDELAEVSSSSSDDDRNDYKSGAKESNPGTASMCGTNMSDDRLRRIEQQFVGGKKAAARYAAKNCSLKNCDLLKSKSHQELQHKFTHLLVTDFEATCDSAEPDYPHEIIEFPCVAVDLQTLKVVAEFGTFVRPVNNPILTPFCTELTTIQQKDVDSTPTIREALVLFNDWLAALKKGFEEEQTKLLQAEMETEAKASPADEGGMGAPAPSASPSTSPSSAQLKRITFNPVFATDGPWDMRKFMHECHVIRDGIAFPQVFYKWVDVRRCFSDFFHKQLFKLTKMLRALGMTFVGERHRGIDDSRNIARVAIALAKRGYKFRQTASIPYLAEGSKLLEHERVASTLLKELAQEEAEKKAAKAKKKKDSAAASAKKTTTQKSK